MWAMFVMHELSGVWMCNNGSFQWKQGLFGDKFWKSFVKWIFDLASPLRHGALWSIWIESNDKVCNQSFWHESKVEAHHLGMKLLCKARQPGRKSSKFAKINFLLVEALLCNLDQTWGARQVLCN